MVFKRQGTDSFFRKTQFCRFFQQGKCARGVFCKFAHAKEELRPMIDFKLTKMCRDMDKKGFCEKGDACTFAHSADELRVFVTAHAPAAQGQAIQVIPAAMMKKGMPVPMLPGRCDARLDEASSTQVSGGAGPAGSENGVDQEFVQTHKKAAGGEGRAAPLAAFDAAEGVAAALNHRYVVVKTFVEFADGGTPGMGIRRVRSTGGDLSLAL